MRRRPTPRHPRRPETLPCPLCGRISPRSPKPGRNPVWCCEGCQLEFGLYTPSQSQEDAPGPR